MVVKDDFVNDWGGRDGNYWGGKVEGYWSYWNNCGELECLFSALSKSLCTSDYC